MRTNEAKYGEVGAQGIEEPRQTTDPGGLQESELADWCELVGGFVTFIEDGFYLNKAAIDALRQDLGLTPKQLDLCWDLAKRYPDIAELAASCIRARDRARQAEAALAQIVNATRAGETTLEHAELFKEVPF